MQGRSKEVKYDKIKEKKVRTSLEELTRGLPDELYQFLNYCRSTKFEEKPNYQYCRELFRGLMAKKGWEMDGQYDWVLKKKGQKAPKESVPQDMRQQPRVPDEKKENKQVGGNNKEIQGAAERKRTGYERAATGPGLDLRERAFKQVEQANKTNYVNQGNARGFGVRTQTAAVGVKDLLGGGHSMPVYQEPKVAKVNVRVSFYFILELWILRIN